MTLWSAEESSAEQARAALRLPSETLLSRIAGARHSGVDGTAERSVLRRRLSWRTAMTTFNDKHCGECGRTGSGAARARREVANLMLAVAAASALAACGGSSSSSSSHPLPPAPDLSRGKFQDKAGGFSTPKMLRLCKGLNAVADGGRLSTLTDAEIVNGTCMMSVLAVETLGRRADPRQTCVEAARNMLREFKTRFPEHEPNETIGRC